MGNFYFLFFFLFRFIFSDALSSTTLRAYCNILQSKRELVDLSFLIKTHLWLIDLWFIQIIHSKSLIKRVNMNLEQKENPPHFFDFFSFPVHETTIITAAVAVKVKTSFPRGEYGLYYRAEHESKVKKGYVTSI